MNGRTAVLAGVALVAVLLAASCGGGGPSGPRLRMVIEPEEGVTVNDLDAAIDAAASIIERRLDELSVAGVKVEREGASRIVVELPDGTLDATVESLGRTALLQFCQPIIDDATGNVAVVREGTVQYQPQTCEPVRDPEGNIQVETGTDDDMVIKTDAVEFALWPLSGAEYDQIVWQPAKAEVEGVEEALDGRFLRPTTFVFPDPVLGQPILQFEWESDGADISEQVTERLVEQNYPLAVFLDGEPIRGEDGTIIAPNVQGVITSQGSITGLSLNDAQELSTLLNTGAFPLPMRVVEIVEIAEGTE